MKKLINKIFICLLVFVVASFYFTACGPAKKPDSSIVDSSVETEDSSGSGNDGELAGGDYAGSLNLNLADKTTKKIIVDRVKMYIDGDTTHFFVNKDLFGTNVVKVRYLAVDTPESTGDIEEYGFKAKDFTNGKLKSAQSIVLESDNNIWNTDSNGRHLCWVWYRTSETAPYRNLNIELLQNGLAWGHKSGESLYGDTAVLALSYAQNNKLNLYSGVPDPDYYRGDAIRLTIKQLRSDIQAYNKKTVAFNGIVTMQNNNGYYLESLDLETGVPFGIYCYFGYSVNIETARAMRVGNEVRIVGKPSYFEGGQSWQVSGMQQIDDFNPDDPERIHLLSTGNVIPFTETTADTFVNSTVEVKCKDPSDDKVEITKTMKYSDAVMGTSISMKNLTVTRIYTTGINDPDYEGKNEGAMTITCVSDDGVEITLRTIPFRDENGNLITQDKYLNKKINIKGVVESFKGKPQIKILNDKNIEIL